jgi:hypothetical protein
LVERNAEPLLFPLDVTSCAEPAAAEFVTPDVLPATADEVAAGDADCGSGQGE